MFSGLSQDVRLGFRWLSRGGVFSVVSVLTLALGIGVNAAMFSLVDMVLLRPLPYADPQRLVRLFNYTDGNPRGSISEPEFIDYLESRAFDGIGLSRGRNGNLTIAGGLPVRVQAEEVSGEFFRVLGVEASRGRYLLPEDDIPANRRVAVISHGFWLRRMGGRDEAIGQSVRLGDVNYTIVGVMPATFAYPFSDIELWLPAAIDPTQPAHRGFRVNQAVARLKPGIALRDARAEMSAIAQDLQRRYPDVYPEGSGWDVKVHSLHEDLVGPYRSALYILLAAVGLLLLIACANVANLMLARGSQRVKETAIRTALGASKGRLARQFFVESLVLASAGGLMGLSLAAWLLRLLSLFAPDVLPRSSQASLNPAVAAFTAGAVAVAAVLSSLTPTWGALRRNLRDDLNQEGRRSQSSGDRRISSALVVGEVALTVALLTGAGLLGRSLLNLGQVDLGFDPDHVLTAQITLSEGEYDTPSRVAGFYEALLERLDSLPPVVSAAVVSNPPLSRSDGDQEVTVEGFAAPPGTPRFEQVRVVSPQYFKTLQIPLRGGRDFERGDSAEATRVAIVSSSFAEKHWPGVDPLGRRLQLGASGLTVVGVVGDVRHRGPSQPAPPILYLPLSQTPERGMTILARTSVAPDLVAADLRSAVGALDGDEPVYGLAPMRELFSLSTEEPRFNSFMLGFFASLALILAAAGIYGVLSCLVEQRRHEFGVRAALGAQGRDIRALVLGFGLKRAALGLVLGCLAAFPLTRYLESLLFGVGRADAVTFGSVWAILLAVCLVACYFPARRASRVEATTALRD